MRLAFAAKTAASTQVFTLARSSSATPERDEAIQRSGAFGRAVNDATGKGGTVTLLTVRDLHNITSYVLTPGQGIESHIVTTLCSAIGAKALVPAEKIPELGDVNYLGWLNARPSESASVATQSGGDQSEVAILLSRIMQPGSWVAMTLRTPTKGEIKNTREWFDYRRDGAVTHYSKSPNTVVASLIAGGASQSEVDTLLNQIVSVIPGFDVDVEAGKNHRGLPLVPSIIATLVVGAGAGVATHHWIEGLGAGVVILVGSWFSRHAPTANRTWEREIDEALKTNELPRPRTRNIPPRSPVNRKVKQDDGTEREVKHGGTYPLAASSLLLAPAMTIGLVSPHASAAAAVSETRMPSVALLDDIGPLVGDARPDDSGTINAPAHLDAAESYQGVFIYGTPGSGKTVAVQNLWAWNTLERTRPSGKFGRPGAKNTIIAFESKGEGAAVYAEWSEAFGDHCVMIEVGDKNSPAIDLTDPKLPPKERAQFFVSAMKYAFGDDAIGDRSSETLQNVLTAAMSFPPEAFATTGMANPSFLDITHALLGGVGDYEDAKAVAAAMTTYYSRVDDSDPKKSVLGEAIKGLGFLYGSSVTVSAWRQNTEAPRNKINLLQQVAHWWSPSRPRGTWSDILVNHRAVVINTGITTSGVLVDESVSEKVAAMIAYALKGSIQRHCSNWQKEGRSVSIFADELALLAPSSAEVIEWLREYGRSYGVRLVLATQRPGQLQDQLRATLRGYGTTMIFQQNDPKIIAEAISDLTLGGEVWNSADISNMPRFHAILSATSGGQRQPPVSIQALYWANEYRQFAIDQGYVAPGFKHKVVG